MENNTANTAGVNSVKRKPPLLLRGIPLTLNKNKTNRKKINIKIPITGGIGLCVLLVIILVFFSVSKSESVIWYVEKGLETAWPQILRREGTPDLFTEIKIWDGAELPPGPGILISTNPWKTNEKVNVYYRLSWELEYQGAIVLALDPWMIFRRHVNAPLTYNRLLLGANGTGTILIPGASGEAVKAWTSRFIQQEPGRFHSDEELWQDWEQRLFTGGRFPLNMRGYDWNTVIFRLMRNEIAWLYAPLSIIRGYSDPRKSILEAAPFPEESRSDNQYSLQAKLLWALPVYAAEAAGRKFLPVQFNSGNRQGQNEIDDAIIWLKNPETQTIIADTLEWIPADPYSTPYDPVSFASHRHWLTTVWIYSINQ